MKRNALHDFYIGMIPTLVTDLFFYIPEEEVPPNLMEALEELKNHGLFDRVFLFDRYKGPVPYNEDSKSSSLLSMATNLEGNIFGLVEKKGEVTEDGFSFLINKYFRFAEGMLHLTRWMNENLERFFPADKRLKGLFRHQSENFRMHFETLVSTFYDSRASIPTQNFDTDHVIDKLFPDLANSFSENRFVDIIKISKKHITVPELTVPKGTIKTPEKLPDKNKSLKKAVVMESEAEKVLLQTYFGIG